MNYLKKVHMICLNGLEFENMYKEEKRQEIIDEIKKQGLSMEKLQLNKEKIFPVIDSINKRHAKNKEEVEIFVSLFGHLGMYPPNSEVCFVLKDSIDPRKNKIKTLADLKFSIKEDSITDFGIRSGDELRQFQLKQFKKELNTKNLFNFIKEKTGKYGNNLGSTNLLILLQSEGGMIDDIDFNELNHLISEIGINPECDILISYNEENKFNVINCVYPTLATCRQERPKDFKWYTEKAIIK